MWLIKERDEKEKRKKLLKLAKATNNWRVEFELADPEDQRALYGYEKLDDDLIAIAQTQLSIANAALKCAQKKSKKTLRAEKARYASSYKKMQDYSFKLRGNPRYQSDFNKAKDEFLMARELYFKYHNEIMYEAEQNAIKIIQILGADFTKSLIHDCMKSKPFLNPYIDKVKEQEKEKQREKLIAKASIKTVTKTK